MLATTDNKPRHTRQTDKQILSAPADFIRQLNTGNDDAVTTIQLLQDKRDQLLSEEKSLQEKTGILSRQIGAAKKQQQPIEQLTADMQSLSAEKKSIVKQLKQLNKQILEHCLSVSATEHLKTIKNDTATNQTRYRLLDTGIEEFSITVFNESSDREEWNDYVATNTASNIHYLIEWADILKRSYGHDSIYLWAKDKNGKVVGLLPMIHISSRLFSNQLVSMPFFQQGGAIADLPMIEDALIRSAQEHGQRLAVDHIEFRDEIERSDHADLSSQTNKVNMVLKLPDSIDELWQGFSPKLRAQIRRPQREEAQVLIGSTELLDDFYQVYSRNMRDLGSPVQSKNYIDNILHTFSNNSWIIVIRHEGRAVAGGFLLAYRNSMEIPLASTIREVNPLSINMLLYWEVLQHAIRSGYKEFNFGRSTIDAGTYRFKQQWGAKPRQLYYNYWLGEADSPPSLNTSNPKYAMIINIWKRLPVWFTQWLGPKLVRNIP